jgi:hypothetical protein
MSHTTALTPGHPSQRLAPPARLRRTGPAPTEYADTPVLRVVPWIDPVADPHGLHPCSRYVELYWLGIIGPSTTWLIRRLSYGLEVHRDGFDLNMPETARSLGLGERMGKNAPFRRALQRLCTFELARPHGPGAVAVRTRIPPLPLRHLSRLPPSLQASHRRWLVEQRMTEPEQMRRRARRLAGDLVAEGRDRLDVERQLGIWHFHPAVAYQAAEEAFAAGDAGDGSPVGTQPGSSS